MRKLTIVNADDTAVPSHAEATRGQLRHETDSDEVVIGDDAGSIDGTHQVGGS